MLDGSQQAPADALAATLRQHGEIVHVDQRTGLKCRESDEARSDSDRVIVEIRKPDDRVPVPLEPRNQAIENRLWQRTTVPHDIHRIGGGHRANVVRMLVSREVDLDDS
jgi:hypothetical protein